MSGAGHSSLMQGVLGISTSTLGVGGSIPSILSAGRLASSGSSQASAVGIPITGPPLMQEVLGTSTSTLGVGSSILSTPSVGELTSSFSGSSQASSIDIPTGPTPGLCHLHVSVYLLTLITAPVVLQLPPVTVNQAELVLSPDTNGLMLTMQRPLVCLVIWNSFDILCALLIFINMFPNAPLAVHFVKEALLNSALRHTPGANDIYQQLMHDKEYTYKIIPLVSHTNAHDCFC